MNSYDHYLVLDLEATCCEDQRFPTHEMETIEIGAVMVDGASLEPISEFQTFIRPVRHPVLTTFCTELTGIQQRDVDQAPVYVEALETFQGWLCDYPNFLFCSWGDYDRKQIEQDSLFHRVPYPIGAAHCNIKKQFSKVHGLSKKHGMSQALALCGLTLEGRHHRGIDDARNMARMMPWIFGDATLPSA